MQIKSLLAVASGLLGLSTATLVQIGFDQALNWPWVDSHPVLQTQISQWLPTGVAFALGIDASQVPVRNLQPLNTQSSLGYITTIASFNLDAALVEQLRIDIATPSSPLYNNPDASVHELISHINPRIPLDFGAAPTV